MSRGITSESGPVCTHHSRMCASNRQEETLIPVYTSIAEAVKRHPEVSVMVNFSSFRSVYETTMDALNYSDTIKTLAIIAEGVPESQTRQIIKAANAKKVRKIKSRNTSKTAKSYETIFKRPSSFVRAKFGASSAVLIMWQVGICTLREWFHSLGRVDTKNQVGLIGPATVGGIKPGSMRIGNTGGMLDNIVMSKVRTSV